MSFLIHVSVKCKQTARDGTPAFCGVTSGAILFAYVKNRTPGLYGTISIFGSTYRFVSNVCFKVA